MGEVRLLGAGADRRLRCDLPQLHAALNVERRRRGITLAESAAAFDCTAARLTNLRTARLADMALVVRITQSLARPAADFIHPPEW